MSDVPKIFITYSWDNEQHKEWVRKFSDRLLSDGVDVTVDQYDVSSGDRLPQFMEQSITAADFVLIICTPLYKQKQIVEWVERDTKDTLSLMNYFKSIMSVNSFQ